MPAGVLPDLEARQQELRQLRAEDVIKTVCSMDGVTTLSRQRSGQISIQLFKSIPGGVSKCKCSLEDTIGFEQFGESSGFHSITTSGCRYRTLKAWSSLLDLHK